MTDRTHEAFVDAQFGPQAQAYVASAVHARGDDLARFTDIVSARPPGAALDLGCGGGHVAFALAPLSLSVVAYDLSEAMTAAVRAEADRRGLSNLSAQCGAAERLPFPDAAFDIVATRHSAHHWNSVPAGLSEARRVLKPGGLLVVMDVVAPEQPLLDTWLQAFDLIRDPSHVRAYSLSHWRDLVEAAGFAVETSARFRVRLEFRSWIERIRTPAVQAEAIRALGKLAPSEVVRHFEIEPDGSFTLDTMLISARC
ncbi:methyltransferase family protein [Roseiarcus fermentans]|uniref:Methyltransferase family protein n=1 Tax=Roseiarcus fermentans TaxID=1473586 RepID=A0A366FQD3_9HYPH|nr:class I SAM-dependent methyltransferase [Roseiarcus fermentans]RBP16828.1 methyltransferase family protein [Roseiarcus fermentans]